MGRSSKTIVWFRRDLRIEDNPALASACRDGCVLPVFIWSAEEEGQFYPGRCSRWWLKQSLAHLDKSLRSLGTPFVFIKAENTIAALLQCINAIGATRLVYNHLYDPVSLVRDHKVKSQLADLGVTVQSFNGDLLYEPWEVHDEGGFPFTTFDSYWAKCASLPMEPALLLPPWKLVPPEGGAEEVISCSLEELCLESDAEKLSNALLSRGWSPGWSNADKLLNEFLCNHLLDYSKYRMKVDGSTTSLLSPYLHFGEISVRKIYRGVRMKQIQWAKEENSEAEDSVKLFLRAIGFREYSRYLCFNFRFTHRRSLLGNLTYYPWRADEGDFKSWRQGRTGYPLVDAGMRELWATGWMHNRIRVVAASFFVKFLLLPWTWGLKYFWDTLLDADLENDILGWQYISGSLPDGHELHRIDNPEVQGYKFDPEGDYVRTWLPELARMPTEWIHHPWDAPNSILKASGVELGLNYPKPLIEIDKARERLDDAVSMMWESDRASRASELNGSTEVVADNLLNINVMDIPKIAVTKEKSLDTSCLDQRFFFIQNLKSSVCEKGSNKFDGQKPKGVIETNDVKSNVKTTKVNEDESLSTAESSSTRKRSFSESQMCIVPASCSAPSYGKPRYEYDSFKPWDSIKSTHPWQQSDAFGVKEVEENKAESAMEESCLNQKHSNCDSSVNIGCGISKYTSSHLDEISFEL